METTLYGWAEKYVPELVEKYNAALANGDAASEAPASGDLGSTAAPVIPPDVCGSSRVKKSVLMGDEKVAEKPKVPVKRQRRTGAEAASNRNSKSDLDFDVANDMGIGELLKFTQTVMKQLDVKMGSECRTDILLLTPYYC